jgi:hypothetical protein
MCSVDDDATTTYLYSRGYNILVSPISISSKIRPFNNISFWKQQSKWLHGAGDQIIFLKTMKTNRKIRDIPLKLYIYSYLEKISPFILSINTIVIIFFSGFFILYNYLENGRNFFVFVPAIWAPLYLFLFLGISKMIIDLWILYRQKKIIKRFFFVFLGLISLLIDSYVVGIIYFIVFIKKWILHIRKTKQTNIPTDKYNYYIKKRSILKYLLPFYSICIFVTLILLTFFTLYYLDIKPFSNDDFVLYFTITSLCTTWIPILVITIVCLFTNKLSKNPKYNKLPESPTDWSQNPYKDLIEKWK